MSQDNRDRNNGGPGPPNLSGNRSMLAGNASMALEAHHQDRPVYHTGPQSIYGQNQSNPNEISVKATFIEKRDEPFHIRIDKTKNGQHLQDKCREKFEEKNWTWRDEVRMLFRGIEITMDKNLMDINGLDNNSELQLVCSVPPTRPLINEVRVQGRNMPDVAAELNSLIQRHVRPVNRTGTPYERNRTETVRSPAYQRFNNCNILSRNFQACIEASQENVRPEDRIRHNQPDIPTPDNPTVGDFGNHLIQLSGKIREYAVELSRLSDLLVRDPAIENDTVKEDIRRLVQNNMDATRYLSPYLQNMTKMCIPLIAEPPRTLLVTMENSADQNRS